MGASSPRILPYLAPKIHIRFTISAFSSQEKISGVSGNLDFARFTRALASPFSWLYLIADCRVIVPMPLY
jgi:hypothetical protein